MKATMNQHSKWHVGKLTALQSLVILLLLGGCDSCKRYSMPDRIAHSDHAQDQQRVCLVCNFEFDAQSEQCPRCGEPYQATKDVEPAVGSRARASDTPSGPNIDSNQARNEGAHSTEGSAAGGVGEAEDWDCPACTYSNASYRSSCEICGAWPSGLGATELERQLLAEQFYRLIRTQQQASASGAPERDMENVPRPGTSGQPQEAVADLGYELSGSINQASPDCVCPVCLEEEALQIHGTCVCKRCKQAICQPCLDGMLSSGRTMACPLCRHAWRRPVRP